jgi:protein ImuB
MLWLCLHFPDFPLELREPRESGCVAIADRRGPRRLLIACSEGSLRQGLQRGMDATTALAQVPTLKLIERSKSQERAALKALAAWAEQFSSAVYVDVDRWLLWIEIGASLQYFQGLEALTLKISHSIESLRYTAVMGVAPTLEAAALLARHASSTFILQSVDMHSTLAPLTLNTLAIKANALEALHGIGWRTIGEVMAIPRDQLARRFGPELTLYLQRLLGECADPREPHRPPLIYRRRFELSAPVQATEPLLFILRRLLSELQGYLRGRDTALQSLRLTLCHEKLPATVLELRTTAPQRDAARLLSLLREQLDRTVLPAPTEELLLEVDRFIGLGDTQQDLFDASPHRDHAWSNLLDKLRARLGEQAIRRLGLRDDHRPEKAWCVVLDDTVAAAQPANDEVMPQRPLWLLDSQPIRQLPKLLGKPERIEAGWWTGEDTRREYYIAETAEGSKWWLYRDAATHCWYLQGLWA